GAIEAYLSIQVALSALDRLEVRGRDSAGIHVLVTGHGLDLDAPDLVAQMAPRLGDRLFTSGAVRAPGGALSFVYKAAAEIGELGDNGAALRAAIRGDGLLRRALSGESAEATVLGHTRWASVGIISQANAHPLNSEEATGPARPYVTAALNGDVDNYVALREEAGLAIPPEVTSDAKIIPALVAHRLDAGDDPDDAFRATVARFDGSVAIAASIAAQPDRLHLALRGSGQGLYVGLAEDAFVVASEPYGLVEETSRYLRLDGEATAGQVVVLDRSEAGTVAGIRRLAYDGTELPVAAEELATAEVTTRDIDRAGYPHFLLKEITEAPQSFRKTLRGRVVERHGLLRVELGPEALPPALVDRLAAGAVRRILVIGQGTAAVAAQSVAASLQRCISGRGPTVGAVLATELSGFELVDDMSDTLVVAVSQSGTTTDTNRTVDLVRGRGATVVAIVNRRNSDLVDRSDGVIYNSDGRDVEMAVPSTKAFYAQVAAGFVLALALADELDCGDADEAHDILSSLRAIPDAMEQVLARRDAIAVAAHRY
ncbi:MAG TPA: SIS domain-containing protein, partial [Acidimicrobiales bacterium]